MKYKDWTLLRIDHPGGIYVEASNGADLVQTSLWKEEHDALIAAKAEIDLREAGKSFLFIDGIPFDGDDEKAIQRYLKNRAILGTEQARQIEWVVWMAQSILAKERLAEAMAEQLPQRIFEKFEFVY